MIGMNTGRPLKIGYLMEKGEEIRRPPYNGPASHVRHVIAGLTERGHRVKSLFRIGGSLWMGANLTDFEPVNVRTADRGPARWAERIIRRAQSTLRIPYFAYFDNRRFAEACLQELGDCDVYLERMGWMMAGGVWAARRLGIPLLLEYNGNPLTDLRLIGQAPKGIQLRIAVNRMTRTLQAADRVIATGDGWRRDCSREWGVKLEQISVVENGTILVDCLDRGELRSFQPADDTGSNRPTLVYIGGFNAWHGLSVLFAALPAVLAVHPNLRLILIGSGPGEAGARRELEALGLSAHVEFTGALTVEQYAPLLARADIGLSPYCGWAEFSGLKIFDYKAAGLACITSGKDGMPRSVTPEVTGLVVPPCDTDALGAAILRLLNDPDLRRLMGRRARIEAETLHRWESTVGQLEAIMYRELSR